MKRFRALRYLLWLVPSALASWLLLLVFMVGGMSVAVAGLGLVVVPWLVVGVRRWTDLHRRLAGSVLGVPIPARRQPRRGDLRQVVTDRGTWRDLGWLVAQGEVPVAVQAAAYFVVAEALTNVAKHSGADVAHVTVSRSADRMYVTVVDDGRGGVVENVGTGIVGVRRRVAALDGAVLVDSPPGGPTAITVELPCGS
jgi:hypothetical protein